MDGLCDPTDLRLLNEWQRDFPLRPRPFALIGDTLGLSEDDVLYRLRHMKTAGRITRVGATCAPNTVSASTLAAISVPFEQVEEVAAVIGAEPGVNHSYEREDHWNLWFVATGPDRAHVSNILTRIETATGRSVLDLRLLRPFNVDLGFSMTERPGIPPAARRADLSVLRDGDRELLQCLTTGLPVVARPFLSLADQLGRCTSDVIARISALLEAGIISRLGVIIRHRSLGWASNAMVVWDVPKDRVQSAGIALAHFPGVTLCYERAAVPGTWPYRLYCMIHARSRPEALDTLNGARALPELKGIDHKVLFSTRCFKQTGALIAPPKPEASV